MKAKPKLDLGLTAYEELFTTDTERASSKLPKIYDIPLELIDDFMIEGCKASHWWRLYYAKNAGRTIHDSQY